MSRYLFFLIGAVTIFAPACIKIVPEGHVGVVFRAGALLNHTLSPGLQVVLPFLDVFEIVQVTMQTDSVTDIPCGTSGGVMVSFGKIEVVNQLRAEAVQSTMKRFGPEYDKIWIFDKIHHEINQFCSKHSLQEVYIDLFDTLDENLAAALQASCDKFETGIEIIAVRVTKPHIPPTVLEKFVEVEKERARLLVAARARELSVAEANGALAVKAVQIEQELASVKGKRDRELVEHESQMAKLRAEADTHAYTLRTRAEADFEVSKKAAEAEAYRIKLMAVAEKERLTRAYLLDRLLSGLFNGSRVYFGDSIPKALGSFVSASEAQSILGAGESP